MGDIWSGWMDGWMVRGVLGFFIYLVFFSFFVSSRCWWCFSTVFCPHLFTYIPYIYHLLVRLVHYFLHSSFIFSANFCGLGWFWFFVWTCSRVCCVCFCLLHGRQSGT
ncbi:hypothetical protein B0T19DRAFT_419817 [Cercophora scortea]|uniref:Uncharacterized protein n=1 Tax=Cercophora scortea TaxID=314031 RepID=A0AAE0IZC5_9PEZI|nr:hypothetical protein B0T19DRAFT_419817 [Cercophora scortea]